MDGADPIDSLIGQSGSVQRIVDIAKKVPLFLKIIPWVRTIITAVEVLDKVLDVIRLLSDEKGKPVDDFIEPGSCSCGDKANGKNDNRQKA